MGYLGQLTILLALYKYSGHTTVVVTQGRKAVAVLCVSSIESMMLFFQDPWVGVPTCNKRRRPKSLYVVEVKDAM